MDHETALDDILGFVSSHWNLQTAALLGSAVKIVYEEAGDPSPRDQTEPWGRLTVTLANARQATFGAIGNRRFERMGLVTMQLFVPKARGVTVNARLAKIATDSMEGKSSPLGVWFRNVRATELGPEGPWYRTNVVADFVYDDIK